MQIAVILKGYPRLSETFIAQELLGLERRGLDLEIWSLRRPYDPATHPIHDEIAAPVSYLPEYLHDEPGRVAKAWARARRLPGYAAAWRTFRADLSRDRTRNRVRRFGQACVLATELKPDIERLYVHFLHTPASVARYAALLRGLPFAISAHAKDIWTTPDWELSEKLDAADWTTTCTRAGAARLGALAGRSDKVALTYHGLDAARFPPPTAGRPDRDGSGEPVVLLSVGRAVEKKGLDDLLAALACLPAGLDWRLEHIGRGELLESLKQQAASLGLADRIVWHGGLPQAEVLAALRRADLFVLASKVAASGDRDGLPNVLMEAGSQGLACLATDTAAIPELIADHANGRLVPPGDPAALADALAALIRAPTERTRLGAALKATVARDFAMDAGLDRLAARLGAAARAHAAE